MLHIFNNKIILFAAILFCLGTYAIKYTHIPTNAQSTRNQIIQDNQNNITNYVQSTPAQDTSIPAAYEQYKQKLIDQEQLVWDLVQTDTGVSKEECLEKQEKDYSDYKKSLKENQEYKRSHYPELKKETVFFVQNILHDFGLNPADIQIVPFRDEGSPAAADDCTIFINEKEFEQFSVNAFKFCIAHEISHLQTQDESIYKSLYSLAEQKKKPFEKAKKALDAFRYFQETRADINALLRGGEKYIPGAFEFFHKLQELDGGDNPGITHPKTSDRIKTAQNICSQMGWNVEHRTI